MSDFDGIAVEQILTALDTNGCLFPQFKLEIENGRPKLIGSGGFSSVYAMSNIERPELSFALKVTGFARHTVSSEEFWNTGRIQWVLCDESPYIVRILDARELLVYFDEEGSICDVKDATHESWEDQEEALLLQFVLMEKLDEIIKKDRFRKAYLSVNDLSREEEVLKFAFEIGQALNLAHGYKVLHRDIKLENIFWDPQEKIYKLGDFGIAKYAEDGNAETVVYTDGYGAPEIERRLYDSYNATADIYSFGISLYLLLNDLRFPGSDGYYPKAEVQYDPEFIFPAPAHASAEMTRVIRKMCSFRSEDRYQDMADVLCDLLLVSETTETQMPDELMEQISMTTETYRQESDNNENTDTEQEHIKTRAEIKEERKAIESIYRDYSSIFFILFLILSPIMLKGMHSDSTAILNPLFWILPIAVLFEAVLQGIREFHLFFGILIIAFSGLSIYELGLTFPHIFMILCVIIGFPILTAASAMGTGLWMLMEITGKPGFMGFFEKYDLGYVCLAFILVLICQYFLYMVVFDKTTYIKEYLGMQISEKLFPVMIAAGIILLILQKCKILEIPDIVERMHLIRTGVISFIITKIYEKIESLSTKVKTGDTNTEA